MCGTWDRQHWLDVINNKVAGYEDRYTLLSVSLNADGAPALQVEEGGIFGGGFHNIYNEDGTDYDYFPTKRESNKALRASGFRKTRTDMPAIVAVSDSLVGSQTDASGNVLVEGRTLDEWFEIGRRNQFGDTPHIHPEFIGKDELTEDEMQADINSLTIEEAVLLIGMIPLQSLMF